MVDGRVVEFPIFEFSFLFANSDVVVVCSTVDNSELRAALLAERKIEGDRIVGASDGKHVGWMRIEPRAADG